MIFLNKIVCAKCGRDVSNSDNVIQSHNIFCLKTPRPEELVEEFLADEETTVYSLSVKYVGNGASRGVRAHIRVGFERLGYSEAERDEILFHRSAKTQIRKPYVRNGEALIDMPDPNSPDSRRCIICDILTTNRNDDGEPFCELCSAPSQKLHELIP